MWGIFRLLKEIYVPYYLRKSFVNIRYRVIQSQNLDVV